MPVNFPTVSVPTPAVGPQGSFGELLNNFITWAIAIGAIVTLIFILMGGFSYVTAQDDADKAEGARKTITNGVIGLIIIGSAFIIWRLVISILGLETIFGGAATTGGGSGGSGGGGAVAVTCTGLVKGTAAGECSGPANATAGCVWSGTVATGMCVCSRIGSNNGTCK